MVVHWVQPGRGLVTCQPRACLARWQERLAQWALQPQVPAALGVGLGVLEICVAGAACAGGEGALAVADLDEVAELVAGLVAGGFVPVVAVIGGDRVDVDDER